MIINIARYVLNMAWLPGVFLTTGFLTASHTASAYDSGSTVNFNVTGKIEEPSCEITIKPSSSIDLGTVSSQHMSVSGATGRNIPVGLEFSSCSANLSSITLQFDGQSYDSTYHMIYKNLDDSNQAAQGIGLQLFTLDKMASLGPDEHYEFSFIKGSDVETLYLIARMYSPYGVKRAGVVKYSATFTTTYN